MLSCYYNIILFRDVRSEGIRLGNKWIIAEMMFGLKYSYLIFNFWVEKKVENEALLLAEALESSRVES